ncbi:MAG: hypothetical protein ACXWCW_30120, partial [Burkholderiales bacterium]
MAMIVRAFPVLAGKEDAARRFAESVSGPRKQDTASFLQAFGVRRESWHLQQTPQGTFIIVVTDVEEPPHEKARAYGASQGAYERWFKDNVRELCAGFMSAALPAVPEEQRFLSGLGSFAAEAGLGYIETIQGLTE